MQYTHQSWIIFDHKCFIVRYFRVTTDHGKQYLIHKGPNFGKSSQTVVVDAKHMSNKWESMGSRKLDGKESVGDLVKKGGKDYKLLSDNCINAAKRMSNGKR